jgi:hypothetical protein
MRQTRRRVELLACISLHCVPGALAAQWQAPTGPSGAQLGVTVGGDVERYLRALTIAGFVAPLPWATRPIGPGDLEKVLRDSATGAHPWRARLEAATAQHASLGAAAYVSANSGFAWGANDGAMWQGRGGNVAIGVAASFRWRFVSAVAAPIAFVAQNSDFPTITPPVLTASPYANALFPTIVDSPQRMGGSAYASGDGGESTLKLRGPGFDAGITTASLGWGMGETFPAIFGSNAGGFPHIFVGTHDRGVRFPLIGRFSGQYILGVLQQSAWSTVGGSTAYIDRDQSGTRRIGVGLNVSYMPAFLPGLELGASRFYHSPYRGAVKRWAAWSKPFEGVFKAGFTDRAGGPDDQFGDTDNQIASFSARWVFPRRGAEAAVELLRDDHNWDARDFAQEAENNSAVIASIRAVTHRSADRLALLTLEYFDGDIRPIAQARAQGFLYSHGYLRQGHTQRGQLLGSPIGSGAIAGARVAWERFSASGSVRAALQRWRTRTVWTTDPEALFRAPLRADPNSHDWIIDGSLASTRLRGDRALTIEGGVAWAGVFNFGSARTNLYTRASWSLF